MKDQIYIVLCSKKYHEDFARTLFNIQTLYDEQQIPRLLANKFRIFTFPEMEEVTEETIQLKKEAEPCG